MESIALEPFVAPHSPHFEATAKGVMIPERKRSSSLSPLFSLVIGALVIVVSSRTEWTGTVAHAFGPLHTSHTPSLRPPTRISSQQSTARNLSNNNNNNNKNNKNENRDGLFDLGMLARRLEKADTIEMRNDATLVACYVLCRFLVWDITSGAKIEPGWEVQDWIWLTGTFSSATVLVVYYVVAGLLSRTYESNTTFSFFGPSPVGRALLNVFLCCPVWLVTEHMLRFGPPDIGGNTSLTVSVISGLVGLGSFMAVAKTLTARMR